MLSVTVGPVCSVEEEGGKKCRKREVRLTHSKREPSCAKDGLHMLRDFAVVSSVFTFISFIYDTKTQNLPVA